MANMHQDAPSCVRYLRSKEMMMMRRMRRRRDRGKQGRACRPLFDAANEGNVSYSFESIERGNFQQQQQQQQSSVLQTNDATKYVLSTDQRYQQRLLLQLLPLRQQQP